MRTKISRWGNSAAVRIPRAALEAAGLREGQEVEVESSGGQVTLRSPAAPKVVRYKIDDLVAEMRRLGPENEPPTLDWGPDRGSEILPDDDWSELMKTHPPSAPARNRKP